MPFGGLRRGGLGVKSCAPIITMSIAEHVATLTNGTDEAKALAVQALLPLALQHTDPED